MLAANNCHINVVQSLKESGADELIVDSNVSDNGCRMMMSLPFLM